MFKTIYILLKGFNRPIDCCYYCLMTIIKIFSLKFRIISDFLCQARKSCDLTELTLHRYYFKNECNTFF